jgi:X-Pro dipeptidyl-peptidase
MGTRSTAALAAGVLCSLALAAPAVAADPPALTIEDGVTQPVFDYEEAIRERVRVEADFDSDADGNNDTITLDIIRPKESDAGLDVPVIMDASPYYTTLGRGNEAERKSDTDGDGLNDRWPLFYDNYFVPRGYAVVLLDMAGTGNNPNGCPVTGGTSDNRSAQIGIDWLNGRRAGKDDAGDTVVADWHNGKTGMIGKSYDGTLANATAALGVEGLSTIVPISAISSWYDYSRSNGIRFNTNYPASLSNTVTNPARRPLCAPIREQLNATDGDETGDYTEFWAERDYNPHVGNVRASVFVVHGINDNNVKPDHFSKWWYGLAEQGVPRKLWLTQTGHIDPFDFRREAWVPTLHRWFDQWLQGYPNGIMNEPKLDIERAADRWETHADWPVPGAEMTNLWLRPGDGPAGTLGLTPALGKPQERTFTDNPNQSQPTAVTDPETAKPGRVAFVTGPLAQDLKFSGTPVVSLEAAADQTDTNLGVALVDYGTDQRVLTQGDGIRNLAEEDCWGQSSAADDACYLKTEKRVGETPYEVITKGILDARNRNALTAEEDLVPGERYEFRFPLLPEDYVVKAGHRLGVVVVGSYPSYGSVPDQTRANITLTTKVSRVELPVVGGHQAALAAGLPLR